jgi:molybdate transport system substrate-binding protein
MVSSLVMCFPIGEAAAADIKVLTTNGLRAVFNQIGPQFERDTGHKLEIQFGAGPVLKKQIESGDKFDVAILPLDISDLIQQGRIVADTRTVLGRTGYGAAVRMGAPKPNIGTTEALRHALLNAKSVVFTAEGVSGSYVLGVLKRLGISNETMARFKPIAGGGESGPMAMVASGEAEIALAGVAAIAGGKGVELVGWLPSELQSYLVFTAGVGGSARDAKAARGLIDALTGPEAISAFKSAGIQPVGP